MSTGLTIMIIVLGCILTGALIGWITSIIMKRSMLKADIAADAKRTRTNAVENAFYAAGCRGWMVKYLGACAVGDQIEQARLEKEFIETEDTVKFWMDNVGRPCKKAVEHYDAEMAANVAVAATAASEKVAAEKAPAVRKTPVKKKTPAK